MHTYVRNSLILSIAMLLAGPDPNTFIAVTITLTSLSTAFKSNPAIDASVTVMDLLVMFTPK